MNSRVAIIDMGTNTFHLLLAHVDQNGSNVLYEDRVPVKIGKGGINQGYITEEAVQRALKALQNFKNTIDGYGISNILAFGTSALRSASNKAEIVQRTKESTGIDIQIISGELEAFYIYEGVKAAVHLSKKNALVIDIGGGSVEFIIGNNESIFWKQSFEIGAQRLMEKFHENDPITRDEVEVLDKYFSTVMAPVFVALEKYHPQTLVGSSGSFDTWSDMYCAENKINNAKDASETSLTIPAFFKIYQSLMEKNRQQRMAIPGMIEMRVDMIIVASCLVKFLLDNWAFTDIRVSRYSLKEGVLSTLIKSKAASTISK